MGKYIIGILFCITMTLGLSEVRENSQQDVMVSCTTDNVAAHDHIIFQILDFYFVNSPCSVSSPSVNGIGFLRNLKFVSNRQVLPSLRIPISENHFKGSSYRYFVYTLRRILI